MAIKPLELKFDELREILRSSYPIIMEVFEIIAIGFGSGLILSIVSIPMLSSRNAERFPLGGFLPTLWAVSNLGITSQIVKVGCLVMGGLLGYYLLLSIWRGRSKNLPKILHDHAKDDHVPHKVQEEKIIHGKALADFL